MRKLLYLISILFYLQSPSVIGKESIEPFVPQAKSVGEGRMSVLFWDVYDATLYATDGDLQQGKPFAIELTYLIDIEGKKIADRSAEEIRKQGFTDEIKLATWHSQMREIFPDVSEGVTLTGIYTTSGESIFLKNNKTIGKVTDPEFGKAFFDIWIGDKTSAPKLRKKLLGDS